MKNEYTRAARELGIVLILYFVGVGAFFLAFAVTREYFRIPFVVQYSAAFVGGWPAAIAIIFVWGAIDSILSRVRKND